MTGNQTSPSNANNVPRDGQLGGWNAKTDIDGFDAKVVQKGDQDRGGGTYRTGQDLSRPGAGGVDKVM